LKNIRAARLSNTREYRGQQIIMLRSDQRVTERSYSFLEKDSLLSCFSIYGAYFSSNWDEENLRKDTRKR
jgi:hypothetical protein